jgi:hypothetical protein
VSKDGDGITEYLVSGALVVREQFIADVASLPGGSWEHVEVALQPNWKEGRSLLQPLETSFYRTGGWWARKCVCVCVCVCWNTGEKHARNGLTYTLCVCVSVRVSPTRLFNVKVCNWECTCVRSCRALGYVQ